eukprot:15441533-Alexandrium_andersonii.AAC.1
MGRRPARRLEPSCTDFTGMLAGTPDDACDPRRTSGGRPLVMTDAFLGLSRATSQLQRGEGCGLEPA